MRKIIYKENEIIGDNGIVYLKEYKPFIEDGIKRRSAIFLCHCGKEYRSRITDVKSNKSSSCGCGKGNKPNKYKNGQKINGVTFINSLGTTNNQQRAIFLCPLCGDEWVSFIGNIQAGHTKSCCGKHRGWSRSEWIKFTKESYFYIVLLYDDNESFVKAGITSKDLKDRLKTVPYNYKVIRLIKNDSGYIYDLENRFLRMYKKYNYKPMIRFNGETECLIKKL